jgi:hypothetical protein
MEIFCEKERLISSNGFCYRFLNRVVAAKKQECPKRRGLFAINNNTGSIQRNERL